MTVTRDFGEMIHGRRTVLRTRPFLGYHVAKYTNQYYWNVGPWYISWFATRLQFIVYVNYEEEQWILWFFSIFRHVAAPGGQIQTSIWLKCCTLADFMICHKFAIHCVCKLWTGMMIFRFFPIFRHIDAPWWPNTEVNITKMKYPDIFHDLLQDCNSLCM